MFNKKFFFNLLYVVLIVALILFMIWMVVWLRTESAVCMRNPLDYFMTKTGNMCYCADGGGFRQFIPMK